MTLAQATFGPVPVGLSLGVVLCGCALGSSEHRTEVEPTLADIQEVVFDPACADCHGGASPAGGLDLSDRDASYASLVEIPAVNPIARENRWLRVKPGDPNLSFLVRKLVYPGVGEGAPMPPGDQEVTEYYVNLVSRWIEDGAER